MTPRNPFGCWLPRGVMARRILPCRLDYNIRQETHLETLVFSRCLLQGKAFGAEQRTFSTEGKRATQVNGKVHRPKQGEEGFTCSSDDDELNLWKWKLEDTWLSKALEPALQMFKRVGTGRDSLHLPMKDGGNMHKVSASSRSLAEVFADLQRSKTGLRDWSISDLTVGLYLVYLRQASLQKIDDVKGVLISSDLLLEDLIYHIELAKGAYKGSSTGLAHHSMLQEKNVLKFVKDSSVMRPGYYIGLDMRKKLVIFGIRGTHTVYDIITDIISSSDKNDVLFEGFSMHFGTAIAARWFLHNEIQTIKHCMARNKGFRLRLVGHSLGGAAASLLAIMLRQKSQEELGFDPCLVSAIGFGTPPCLSKDLAQNCSNYVSTVVMQDDIIPRLSISSLMQLRNEIIQTDWTSFLEKEDWGTVLDWISNAKQVLSSVQDVARRLADHAKFKRIPSFSDFSTRKDVDFSRIFWGKTDASNTSEQENAKAGQEPDELFVPGTLYYLKKQADNSRSGKKIAGTYTLWRMQAGEHVPRILLSGNLISDHRCDSHYNALREVLKGLPLSNNRGHF